MVAVELRLPRRTAAQLRVAAATVLFAGALDRLLDDLVLEIDAWPRLRELAWNRADRWIPARDALAIHERNWRFVDPAELGPDEAALIVRLKHRYGSGVLNV
jgi:hypothetical protein